jgi:hypothetical protein
VPRRRACLGGADGGDPTKEQRDWPGADRDETLEEAFETGAPISLPATGTDRISGVRSSPQR